MKFCCQQVHWIGLYDWYVFSRQATLSPRVKPQRLSSAHHFAFILRNKCHNGQRLPKHGRSRYTKTVTREFWKRKRVILVYFKSDVGSTQKNGVYKQCEPSLICCYLVFVFFWLVMILWHVQHGCCIDRNNQRTTISGHRAYKLVTFT